MEENSKEKHSFLFVHATFLTRFYYLARLSIKNYNNFYKISQVIWNVVVVHITIFFSFYRAINQETVYDLRREKNNAYTKNSVQFLFDGIERNDWLVFGNSNDIEEIQCTTPIKWYKVLCVLYILFALHSLINFHYLIQKQHKINSFTCLYVSALPFFLRIKVDSATRCRPPTTTTKTKKRKDN